jgi:hypothetical protein
VPRGKIIAAPGARSGGAKDMAMIKKATKKKAPRSLKKAVGKKPAKRSLKKAATKKAKRLPKKSVKKTK